MKRILFITGRRLFPVVSGGQLRAEFIVEVLRRRYDVAVLSVDRDAVGGEVDRDRETAFPLDPGWSRALRAGLGRLSGIPLQASLLWSSALRAELARLRGSCDGMLLHLARSFPLVAPLGDLPMMAELTDCVSATQQSLTGGGVATRLLRGDAAPLRRLERSVILASRLAVVISERDREALVEHDPDLRSRIEVVPNGYDFRLVLPPTTPCRSIAFLGDYLYPPNRIAAEWMRDELLPRLPGDFAIHCYGRGILGTGPRFHHHGFVEDLPGALRAHVALVAPMQQAGGMQNKVVDGVRAGIPALMTAVVADGIGLQGELRQRSVAGSAIEFTALVTRLVEHPDERQDLHRWQLDFLQSRYDHGAIADRYLGLAVDAFG